MHDAPKEKPFLHGVRSPKSTHAPSLFSQDTVLPVGVRRPEVTTPEGYNLDPHWLKALALGMDDPRAGLVAYARRPDGREPAFREAATLDLLDTRCLLLRMKMLEEIGVLLEADESEYPLSRSGADLLAQAYGGSRGLSARALAAGWKMLVCHYSLGATGREDNWNYDPDIPADFQLDPLWASCDRLEHPGWVDPTDILTTKARHPWRSV